jgi:hypothetical protein
VPDGRLLTSDTRQFRPGGGGYPVFMTMLNNTDFIGIIGLTVRSDGGDKIGKVVEVQLDDRTWEPEWMEVNTGFLHSHPSVVPLARATRHGGTIVVPFDKDKVRSAPAVGDPKFISASDEVLLYEYYGISFEDAPSDPRLRLPERLLEAPSAPVASTPVPEAPVPSSDEAPVPSSDEPFEEWTKDRLYQRAKEIDLRGRSSMNKQQLVEALRGCE